jgi:hypothetical protein
LALALAAAVPPFVAYRRSLHPGLPAGDSGELITVAATFGVAHPPGYPLWTMLGGLWARALSWGSVAWRLNLFSAVAMAVAAVLLAAAVRRVTGSRVAGVVAAWAFALSAPAWKYALVAEVFALNALLAAAALLALAHAVTAKRGGRAGAVGALAFLCALALSHHHTLLLLAVPAWAAAFALASDEPSPVTRQTRALTVSAAWAFVGLLPLAWLVIAPRHNPALAWGDTTSVQGFFSMLLRAEYGTLRLDPLQSGMKADTSHALLFARALPRALGELPLVLAAVGAVAVWARSRALALAIAGFAALQAAFFTRVGFPSDIVLLRGVIERFYILPILVLAFLAGLGAAWLLTRFPARRAWHAFVAVFLLAATIGVPWAERCRGLDQRDNVFVETLGRGILASLPPGTVLFVQGDLLHNALAYLMLVEHERPDVVVLDQELMTYPWYVRRVRAAHPDVLPALGRGEHVTLADGRVFDGIAIPREDGTVDLLAEHGQLTLPARDIANVAPVPAETLFAAARAGFRSSALLEASEDRYSGLPGTRNLLWLDHLAGKRPVAFLGVKDESYSLRYELAPAGFVTLAFPHGTAPGPAAEAANALAVLEQVPLEPWFRAYDPTSFEAAERWRFASVAARTMLLCSRPEAAEAVRANTGGHERLLAFARRFEPLEPTPNPACLRAVAFLRVFDPAFRDLGAARRDFERYAATGAAAARDAEVRDMLARLPAGAAR